MSWGTAAFFRAPGITESRPASYLSSLLETPGVHQEGPDWRGLLHLGFHLKLPGSFRGVTCLAPAQSLLEGRA